MAASLSLALGEFGPAPVYLGRLLAGLTVGTAMAVGTTWLKELSQAPFDDHADAGAGARRTSVAFALGSGLGALVAGALAQWGPWPKVLPFVIDLAVTIPFLLIVPRVTETHPGSAASGPLREQLRVPTAVHPRFRWVVLVVAPWLFGSVALAYGYLPVLLSEHTPGYGVAYATLLTVVALTISAIVQPIAKRLDDPGSARGLSTGMATLTVAVGCIGVAATLGSPLLGIGAAAVTGIGMGVVLPCGLLEVQRIAGPRDLAGLTGVFYAVAYVGFLLPTAMAAITPPFTTPQLFAVLVLLCLGSTFIVRFNDRRHLPGGSE